VGLVQQQKHQARQIEAARQASGKSLKRLEEEKAQIVALMKRSAGNPALLAELEKDFDRVERDLSLERVAGGTSAFASYDKEAVVETCLTCLCRTSDLWRQWPVESQSRLQRLVLPQGISYDALAGNRTPQLSLIYAAIPNVRGVKAKMAPPRPRVTNQVIEEMIGWYDVLTSLPDWRTGIA
jgi:hypothetical protein